MKGTVCPGVPVELQPGLSLARKAVRFVEVLEDEEHYRDPDVIDQFRGEVLLQSPEWGDWRK